MGKQLIKTVPAELADPRLSPGEAMARDEVLIDAQYGFTGEWLPDVDPSKIGPKNFKRLQNCRYGDGHPEGIQGYTKINTTAIANFTGIRNGLQFRSDRTQKTYTLVYAEHGADPAGNPPKIFQNLAEIPAQGDFEATEIHQDASGAGMGRFSKAPMGNISYCNESEACIWAGIEMRIAAMFTIDDAAYANPVEQTEAINNILDTTANLVSIGTQKFWLVFSTRPIRAVKYYIKTANGTASVSTAKEWNGTTFAAVAGFNDGTSDGGKSLAKTGSMSFTSTVATAKPFHFQEIYLYAYLFELSAGSAELYHGSVDAPFQDMVDVWDGVYRQPTQLQVYRNAAANYEDYTLEVNEPSNIDTPIGAVFDEMGTADYAVAVFDDRMAAVHFTMLATYLNLNAATVTIYYWNGSTWTTVGAVTDGTLSGGKSLAQSGLMSWNPPAIGLEHKVTLFGTYGHAYKFVWSAKLSGIAGGAIDILVDIVKGVPAQKTIKPFKFPTVYKDRTFLFGYTAGKEGNRADYVMSNAPDVMNGYETSNDGEQSLYFGGVEDCSCATQLYNRFGSNIYANLLVLKAAETYLLTGDGPEDYRIYPVSFSVGCPAPLTLDTAEVGFKMADDVVRNVAIWLSASGPVIFDGAILHPVKKIKRYFDPTDPMCVNYEYIHRSRGNYDAIHKEYNLIMPCGVGQEEPNVWLVYDLLRERWYEKDTGAAKMLLSMFPAMDNNGVRYLYAGRDDGHVMRLGNGNNWDGVGIRQRIELGDFWPSNNIWDQTRIRRLKLVAKRITEDHSVDIYYSKDTDDGDGTEVTWKAEGDVAFADWDDIEWGVPALANMELSIGEGLARLARTTKNLDLLAWCHGFGFRITTSNTIKGFQPMMWGIQYVFERKDA